MLKKNKSNIGSYLRSRMPCRGCEILYTGLDRLSVEKIKNRIPDLVRAFAEKISGETREKWQWSDDEISDHLGNAIAAESGIRGIGDVVEHVLHKAGIKKRAGCNCHKRQKKLNKDLPLS